MILKRLIFVLLFPFQVIGLLLVAIATPIGYIITGKSVLFWYVDNCMKTEL